MNYVNSTNTKAAQMLAHGAAKRRLACLLAGAAFFAAAMPALAADAAPEAEASILEEITVTARKRAESAQEVPIAMSVLPQELVEVGNLDQVADFVDLVPNATITNESNTSAEISIRGSGRSRSDEDPSVGLYRDGIYIGGLLFSTATFYDTERVEILRGPQAGLYGRNAVGGAMNVISVKPSFDLGGFADVLVGTKDRAEFRGAVNVPVIKDVWALRLSGLYINQDEGFDYIANQDRYSDATEVKSVRLRSRFEPNENWEFLTTAEYVETDGGGPLTVAGPNELNAYFNTSGSLPVPGAPGTGTSPGETGNQLRNTPEFRHFEQTHLSQEVNWRTDAGTATGIVSYRKAEFQSSRDEDNTEYDVSSIAYDAWQESVFAELRFASEKVGGFSFVAGATYLDEEVALNFENRIGALFGLNFAQLYSGGVVIPPFNMFGPPLGAPIAFLGLTAGATGWGGYYGDTFPTVYTNEQTLESKALFLEFNQDVTDKLSFWGNIRRTEDTKSINFSQDFAANCQVACVEIFATPLVGIDPRISLQTEVTFTNTSLGGGINYKVSDSILAYGKVVEGFKAGGFNSVASDESLLPFDEEESIGYELGVKSDWFDRRLRVNVAAFLQDRKDVLVTVPDIMLNSIGVNAGKVQNKGFELELSAALIEGLRLDLSAGYLDSEFKEFQLGLINYAGNKVPRTFKYSLSAILSYERPVTDEVDFYGFASYRNGWDGYVNHQNTEEMANPETVDLRFGVKSDAWKLGAYVDNLFDNRYTTSEFVNGARSWGTFAPGRTFGVQAVRNF